MSIIGELLGLVFFVFIIIIAVVLYIKYKKSKQEKEKQQQLAYQKKIEEEKQKKLDNERLWLDKLKNNQTTLAWAEGFSKAIANHINENSYIDHEFHFKAYLQDFEVGFDLQDRWYPHTKKSGHGDKYKSLVVYHFAEEGLPELTYQELPYFSFAFSQLIQEKLAELEITVQATRIARRLVLNDGWWEQDDDSSENYIGSIYYTRKKSDATW